MTSELAGARRVLVIGAGGAGKSTFARELGAITGLPVVHLDRMYWRAGWIEPPKEEFRAALALVVATPAWILDGNYSGSIDQRIDACDAIVWLDLPRVVCLAGVIERRVRHRGRPRDDMAAGCDERLTWEFVRWIWDYPTRSAPKIEARLARARDDGKRVVRLRSRRAIARVLNALRASG